MENGMTRVTEVLAAKYDLIPPGSEPEYNRAKKYWDPIATTQSGKFAVIDDAKNGDKRALAYLFWVVAQDGRIEKTLKWKFLGPNPTSQKNRITHGDDLHVYRSLVMEALGKALSNWKNPDPSIDYFISLKNFTWNHLVNLTRDYNVEQNRGGMAGKVMKGEEEPQIGSYETYTAPVTSGGRGKDIATKHDPFHGTDELDAWETFVNDNALDAGKSPTLREVLKYFIGGGPENFNAKAAAAHFDKTHITIYNKLASMKPLLLKHGIDERTFANLLQTHGAELARTL